MIDLISSKKELIALGGHKGSGKTKFSILLANRIAKTQKVLFLNWIDYADKLHNHIVSQNEEVSENLTLNTNIDYFSVGSFLDIIDLIKSYNYTTIFIDDINYFTQSHCDDYFDTKMREETMRTFKYLVEELSVSVIFNININESYLNGEFYLNLGDFVWSRLLVNDCDKVFIIKQQKEKDFHFDMYKLKGENNKIEKITTKL